MHHLTDYVQHMRLTMAMSTTRYEEMMFVGNFLVGLENSRRSANPSRNQEQEQAKYGLPCVAQSPKTICLLISTHQPHHVIRKPSRTTKFFSMVRMSSTDSDAKPTQITKQTTESIEVATYDKTNPVVRLLVSILTFGLNNNAVSAKESDIQIQPPNPTTLPNIGSELGQDQYDLIAVLTRDYANEYFLTGDITDAAYELDCRFVDPTVTIQGLNKWKQSIRNLGYFFVSEGIDANSGAVGNNHGKSKQRLVLIDIEMKDNAVHTKWLLDVLLKLPWKPRIQVHGTTIHSINSRTKRIYRHEERWITSVPVAFQQLFTPSR
mmetsp:Transcript_2538/g.4454  ORF Transcript_2538/g.4454 Transcript_2538/m.4454 type:complete len:321 (-) Transcript_2538:197-1159(-)